MGTDLPPGADSTVVAVSFCRSKLRAELLHKVDWFSFTGPRRPVKLNHPGVRDPSCPLRHADHTWTCDVPQRSAG